MKIRILGGVILCLMVLFGSGIEASALTVDIYSGFTWDGGGAPYFNLVGSFTSPDIMFATNTGWNWHPFGLGSFGAEITGFLYVATAATYTFTLSSDDGSMFYVNGNLVIDNGGGHGPWAVSGSVDLSAGTHPFRVEFFEDFGGPSGLDLILPQGVRYVDGAVPEPATLLLLGLGLIGAAGIRRKVK